MPKYIDLTAAIKTAIESVIKNNGYKGCDTQVEFEIDWENEYQKNCLCASSNDRLNDDEYPGLLSKQNNYPLKSDKLLTIIPYDFNNYHNITKLVIYNYNGWNKDDRSRGKKEEDQHIIHPEWYENYDDTYKIIKEEGISFNDIINGVFAVKSGKLDDNYELFTRAYCRVNQYELYITLEFDHGS